MKLLLKRRYRGPDYTIGSLSIDGVYFCDTLEDKERDLTKDIKIKHETAIPKGLYSIIVNRSPKFGRDLPRLLNVPQFEGILIHRGNKASHSSGCILVGENKVKGGLINSTKYELELVNMMRQAIAKGEKVSIEVV